MDLAVIGVVARCDPPEGGDLLALLGGQLGRIARLLERFAGHVIVDRHQTPDQQRGTGHDAAPLFAPGAPIAPVLVQAVQGLLAGGHHAIFTQTQLRRRLPLAQQDHPLLDRLRQVADVQMTHAVIRRVGSARRFRPVTAATRRQIDLHRWLDRFRRRIETDRDLGGPTLGPARDHLRLARAPFLRRAEGDQHRSRIGGHTIGGGGLAQRGILDLVGGNPGQLCGVIQLVQQLPVRWRYFRIRAQQVEHQPRLHVDCALAHPGRLRFQVAVQNRLHAHLIGLTEATPQVDGPVIGDQFEVGKGQRAKREFPGHLDLHEQHRIAQLLQHFEQDSWAHAATV